MQLSWLSIGSGMVLVQVLFLCAARDFSPRVSFQCRLSYTVFIYSPFVRSHALTYVCMLKILSMGGHAIVCMDT